MRFLSAIWSNLALITYAVPVETLEPCLPPGCTADLGWEGKAHVSLVAFDFLKTRVLGIGWPGFRNFPEINLRAYVRHNATGDRGVTFIRELVPSRIIAAMARWTYNEPYASAPMQSKITRNQDTIQVDHGIDFNGRRQHIQVRGQLPCAATSEDGLERFFTQQRWGFNRSRSNNLIRYEVVHPLWNCYQVQSWQLDWDFAAAYGRQWAILQDLAPSYVLLAEGSNVEVRVGKREESSSTILKAF